ncbi:MAG: tetratricopeptide repeat protein [Proteobacteria bacterium]|nr:tetratricopeptide repeat protein [Pseudomonadota bacterium]
MADALQNALESGMAKANALYGDGALEQADRACDTLLTRQPGFGEALNLKGIIAFRNGRFEAAIKFLIKATEVPAARPNFFNNLGEVLRQNGLLDSAEEALRNAVAMDPGYAVALNNLGVVLTDRGKIDEAFAVLKKALDRDGQYADAHNNLGTAYLGVGRFDDAEKCFRDAISIGPVKPEYCFNLGLALEEQEDEDGALAAYQQSLSLDYGAEKAFENFCGILFAQDDAESVRGLSRELQSVGPELAYPYFYSGKSAFLLGDLAAARRDLAIYLERAPDDAHGAALLLASQGAAPVPAQANEAFLKKFYQRRAQGWDRFVTTNYHGHAIIFERLESDFGWPCPIKNLLDLGCGTGALGLELRDKVGRLDGIDISPEMIHRAEAKAIYDGLVLGDACDFLRSVEEPYTMVIAAAMLFHLRDLDEIFSLVAKALAPGGGFVFTVFRTDNPEPELNAYNLYLHSRPYLERTLGAAGFGEIVISDHIHEYERKTIPRYCLAVSCRKV